LVGVKKIKNVSTSVTKNSGKGIEKKRGDSRGEGEGTKEKSGMEQRIFARVC